MKLWNGKENMAALAGSAAGLAALNVIKAQEAEDNGHEGLGKVIRESARSQRDWSAAYLENCKIANHGKLSDADKATVKDYCRYALEHWGIK